MAVKTTNDGADATDATDTEKAAIAPATTFSTSGAPVQIVPDVKPDHPAVDNDPRANTTVRDNAITFNDPNKPGPEAVADLLAASGSKPTAADDTKA